MSSAARRRLIAVAAAAGLLVALAGVVLVARGRASEEVRAEIAAAERFRGFPLYWVGERFEKWELRAVELPGGSGSGFASFVYGDCDVQDPDGFFGPEGGSCSPPLQIQVSPLCFHLDVVARAPIWMRRTVRGAPVGSSDSAPVLFTRGAQVKVYRGQGSDPGLAMRALRALRSLNGVPPVIGASGPIPAPDRRVLSGSTPCRDSRAGVVRVDEWQGTYRGVGIGDTATDVRRTLGATAFADLSKDAVLPTAAGSAFAVGAPSGITPPCRPTTGPRGGGSRLQVLRYAHVSFLFCDGRVFALVVTDRGARTQAGLRIGESLDDARRLYPGLACGEVSSGDAGRYPYCVGRLERRRSLWFGQDPIGSITMSATRYGVPGER